MNRRCETCLNEIEPEDDVVVVERLFRLDVYHANCYEPNNFDYILTGRSSTIYTVFGVLLCLFVGIRAPELWLKIFAALAILKGIAYRVYAYVVYERER